MTFNEFIFSDKKPHKLSRHLTFWGVFGATYYAQSVIPTDHMFYTALISFLFYLPACLICVYGFIGLLFPLLRNGKYIVSILVFLIFAVLTLLLNYFTSIAFNFFTCDCPMSSLRFLTLVSQSLNNGGHALTTGGLIVGFKLAKEWFLKQKENQQLMKLKVVNDLHLQKARLYPGFLFQSLDVLYKRMRTDSTGSPELIVKLSDLLSYLLYESNEELIPLEKELVMIANLVSIQNINQAHHLTIQSHINANSQPKLIKPLILFPLLQNCFEIISKNEKGQFEVDVQIVAEAQILHMSIVLRQLDTPRVLWGNVMKVMRNRLEHLYQHTFEIKIKDSPGGSRINLDLKMVNNSR